MKADDPQPIVVPSSSGSILRELGVTHKLTRNQTGGAYYLFESEFDPESGTKQPSPIWLNDIMPPWFA